MTPSRDSAARGLAILAPLVYLATLSASVVGWGLPLARDQLFFWLGMGLLACTVRSWRRWPALAVDWVPFFGLLVAYDWLRGAVSTTQGQAHVTSQLDVDRWLGGGADPTVWLQDHLWHPRALHAWDYGAWGVYMTHFFAVWVVAAVLWRRSRARFHRYAVLTMLVTLGAFLTYWLYPAQPPWMAAESGLVAPLDRIVPEVWGRLGVHTAQSLYEDGRLVNPVAAMPSLHAAYPVMLLLFLWPAGWLVRAGLGLYALAMGFTLVYSGEHFVADVVAGWALAASAYALLRLVWWTRARGRAPDGPAKPHPGGAGSAAQDRGPGAAQPAACSASDPFAGSPAGTAS